MSRALGFLLIAGGMSGCTQIRNITATAYTPQGVYVGFWEGTCKPVLGCDVGDGKVQFCRLDASTNALVCEEQTSMTPLLDRKTK